jgi:hypothetical protein
MLVIWRGLSEEVESVGEEWQEDTLAEEICCVRNLVREVLCRSGIFTYNS